MTLEEYFQKNPIENKELTEEDLDEVEKFCIDFVKTYKREDKSLSKQQKIDSFKSYCDNFIHEHFKNKLTSDGIGKLMKSLNVISTLVILRHLED